MGLIFGSGTERTLDGFFRGRTDAARDFTRSMADVSVPIGFPDAVVPIIEQFSNRSLFMNRTLVPSEMEKGLPEYQYTPYTTETSKALGQLIGAFPGIREEKLGQGPLGGVARAISSPILLENYLRAWTGNLGMYGLQAADLGLRKSGVLPDPVMPTMTLADIPVVKAFVARYPSTSVESIQQFNDVYDKNKMVFDTWQQMAKDGNQQAMRLIQDTQQGTPMARAAMTPESAMMLGMGRKPLTLGEESEKALTSPIIRDAIGTRSAVELSAIRAEIVGAKVDQFQGPITLQDMADIRSTMTEHSQLIRDIYKNQDIPSGEKRQLIDTLYYRMQELAQIGMNGVRRAEAAEAGTDMTRFTTPPAYRIPSQSVSPAKAPH